MSGKTKIIISLVFVMYSLCACGEGQTLKRSDDTAEYRVEWKSDREEETEESEEAEESEESRETTAGQDGQYIYNIENVPDIEESDKKYYVWEDGPTTNFINGSALMGIYEGSYGYDRIKALTTWYGRAYIVGWTLRDMGDGYYSYETQGEGYCVINARAEKMYCEKDDATVTDRHLYGYYYSEKSGKQYFLVDQGRPTIDGKKREAYIKICKDFEEEGTIDLTEFYNSGKPQIQLDYLGNGIFLIGKSDGRQKLYDCESEQLNDLPDGVTFEKTSYSCNVLYSDSSYIIAKKGGSVVVFNRAGEIITEVPGETYGPIGNGLFYTDGCFYNLKGEKTIDLSRYKFKEEPVFHEGYACLNLVSDDDIKFHTIIDTEGNLLYEPVPGTICGGIKDDHILVLTQHTAYYQDMYGNTEWSDSCGAAYALGEGIICLEEYQGYQQEKLYRFYTVDHQLLFDRVYGKFAK